MRIKTVGVLLTDKEGSIVGEEGKPAFAFMPSSVRALDQAIMRRTIQTQENPIIVIGETTFNEIKNGRLGKMLSAMKAPIFVSSKQGVRLYEQEDQKDAASIWDFQDGVDTKEELRRIVYAAAYAGSTQGKQDSNIPYTIVVLGGHSVYAAFNYHYTHVHHNKYQGSINGDRHVNIVGEDPRTVFNGEEPEKAMIVAPMTHIMYSDNELVYYVHTIGEVK